MKKVEQKNEVQEAASENKEPNALVITMKLAEAIAAYLLDQKMADVEGLVNGIRSSRGVFVTEEPNQEKEA
jgi:hypothetical protein